MKSLLVVKLGSTFSSLAAERGDFEDWIRARLGTASERLTVADARNGPLPRPVSFAGIILTGSHSMVTDREPWSECAAQWVAGAVAEEVPLLGICYGHQLLAHALGGEVGRNPAGREFGTVEVKFFDAARHDPLFAEIPRCILAHSSHTQSVLRLPRGARRLAASDRDGAHAFAFGRAAWGVQFHPEFDTDIAAAYVRRCAADLHAEGADPDALVEQIRETPQSASILGRFGQMVCGADR